MIGIVADITERKLAEEERFRHAAIVESSSDAIIAENCDGIITSWNAGAQHIFGYSEAEAIGKPSTIIIPPDLVPEQNKVLERLRAGDRIEHYETVRIANSGKRVDVSVTVSPVKDSLGKIVGFSKIDRDITERRLAEQAMAEMSRKLVAVQEEERTRIARDLHDDINQRLALLAIETETLRDNLPKSGDEMGRRLTHIRERIVDVSTGVQSIAHQLHSSQLEYLGIVAAMKIFCREYSARQSVEIDFTSDDIPKLTSPEISLGLFRIMQEALSNATKHSRVRHFEVKLGCSADQLHLTVSDLGSGFDSNAAVNKRGIGLFSMRERALLMNGTIAIESKPLGGTTIKVHVPFKAEQSCAQATG
jgi:PAS domain S-box-containing protein